MFNYPNLLPAEIWGNYECAILLYIPTIDTLDISCEIYLGVYQINSLVISEHLFI